MKESNLTPGRLKPLRNPTDVQGVQRLNGMVKYLSKFLSNLSQLCQPLRKLKHRIIEWPDPRTKRYIPVSQNGCYTSSSPQVSQPTSPSRRTRWCIAKWLLFQESQPVTYVSGAHIPAEQRYSQIDRERLARSRTQSPLLI